MLCAEIAHLHALNKYSYKNCIYLVWLVDLTCPHQENSQSGHFNELIHTEIGVAITGNWKHGNLIFTCSFHEGFPTMHIYIGGKIQ